MNDVTLGFIIVVDVNDNTLKNQTEVLTLVRQISSYSSELLRIKRNTSLQLA